MLLAVVLVIEKVEKKVVEMVDVKVAKLEFALVVMTVELKAVYLVDLMAVMREVLRVD